MPTKTPKAAGATTLGEPKRRPNIVDDPAVKALYADDFVGLLGVGANFHLAFAARRPVQGRPVDESHVTARLVLPINALLDLYGSLQQAVSRLEAGGLVRSRPAGASAAPAE